MPGALPLEWPQRLAQKAAWPEEWDYVLLSTVRSSPGGLGALEDEHLLDVALTRARRGREGCFCLFVLWLMFFLLYC